MPGEIGVRAQIALLLYTTLNIAVFTVALYVVMPSPTLNEHAGLWLTVTMIASLLVTAPLCWMVAPHINGKWRKKIVAQRSPLATTPTRPI